jgi:hypothetical protein
LYQNGFELGDPGAADFYDSTTGNPAASTPSSVGGVNEITVVPSGGGQLGLTAPQGSNYAEIANVDDTYQAGYGESVITDYGYERGGGTYVANQPTYAAVANNGQAFYESTEYYMNTNWVAAGPNNLGQAFWIDTTPYSDPGYLDESNFRIQVNGPSSSTPIQVLAAIGNPGTEGSVANITTSGWYTFKTTFEDDGGFVENDLIVLDPLGNEIGDLSGVTTLPWSSLLGTNYGDWTTVWEDGFGATVGPNENGAADILGIDNVQVGIVPEPASFSLLGVGALALMRRRRGTIRS